MATARRGRGRRLALIALAAVAVIAAVAVSVPFLISSEAVRKRVAEQITHWTGRSFTFSGEPRLRLFPYLTVRLQNARLGNPEGMGAEPFMAMDFMTGKLEILPLFLGRLEFAEFRLVNPRIRLKTDAEGRPNWVFDQGIIGTQLAKGDSELPGNDTAPPSPRANISLGRFIIRDGQVTYSDARNRVSEVLEKVNVDFSWRGTAEAAGGSGSFVWRGETVSFRGQIGDPFSLLAGGESPLRLSVEAAPATLAFDGMARQIGGMQIAGAASLKAPSVARLIGWTKAPVDREPLIGAISLEGRMEWTEGSLHLGAARIDLDGNLAEGALAATLVDNRPGLQGTIAFDRLDLSPYLRALSPGFGEDEAWLSAPAALPLMKAGAIDLRLSANQVVAGSAVFGPAAAAIAVKNGRLAIDLGEAQFGEGFVEASLSAEARGGVLSAAVAIKADDVPFRAVFGQLLPAFGAIDGVGSAALDVAGSGARWSELIGRLAGGGQLTVTDGTIEGIDLARLPALIAGDAAAAGGSTAFATASCTLSFADGSVSTADLAAEGDGFSLSLAGRVSLIDPAIEARGVLSLATDPPSEIPFLVDGAIEAPRVRPDLGPPIQRDTGRPPGLGQPPRG